MVTQVRGTWDTAIQAPGVAAIMNESAGLSAALISSVSCPSAGSCTVGGFAGLRAFVLSQVNGRCRPAQVLSGAATLSKARLDILTVACGSPGNCGAAVPLGRGARGSRHAGTAQAPERQHRLDGL